MIAIAQSLNDRAPLRTRAESPVHKEDRVPRRTQFRIFSNEVGPHPANDCKYKTAKRHQKISLNIRAKLFTLIFAGEQRLKNAPIACVADQAAREAPRLVKVQTPASRASKSAQLGKERA
jgi:hypothetical protein